MTAVHEFSWAGESLTGLDDLGIEWTVEESDGWTDGAGIRASREVKAGQDGEWPTTPLRTSRVVTLRGKALAPTHAALEAASRRHASRALMGSLVGESEGSIYSGDGYLLDTPRMSHLFPSVGVWQLTVNLPDPLLYGPPAFAATTLASTAAGTGRVWPRQWPRDWGVPPGVTPGAITLPNAGTAAYWPRLRVDGPVPNPTVTMVETGDTIRFNGTVAAGQWLDIDCGNRRVLLNGQVSMRHLVSSVGRWLAVPKGGGSLTWTADAADPAASLSAWGFESAWL